MLPHHPPPHHACSNLCVWCLSLSHSFSVSHSNKYELFHMGYQDNISHRLRSLSLWQSGQGKQSYMTTCACLRVFACLLRASARCHVQLCWREAAGCQWERTAHNTYRCADCTVSMGTSPHPSPSHYHQHIPPPSIAPHCSCKSLTSSSNASRFVFMQVQAFLVELSHQLQLNLSPPLPPKCACQVRVHG